MRNEADVLFDIEYYQERTMKEFNELLNPNPLRWKVVKEVINENRITLNLRKKDGSLTFQTREDIRDVEMFNRRWDDLKYPDALRAVINYVDTGILPSGWKTNILLTRKMNESRKERLRKWRRIGNRIVRKES